MMSDMQWLENAASRISSVAIAILIGSAMALAALLTWPLQLPAAGRAVLLAGVIVTGVPIVLRPLLAILRGNFSVDVLAVLSITVAALLGQYWVAAIVILMLSGGEALEDYATRRASSVLSALAKRMPQVAHEVKDDGVMVDVAIDTIVPGQRLRIFPHEICPVDGTVVEGDGSMDESYLTGEPYQIEKTVGAAVLSGAINGNAVLTIRADKPAADSRYARIVTVLHDSEQQRPKIRRLGDRLGSWYTPLAVGIALVSGLASHSVERFLAVLVIATPCPLLLAIPVAVIGAISVAASRGILVKDPSILEKLDSCRILVVDKTGTLTYGKPSLHEIVALGGWSGERLLGMTAAVERYSKHPLADAVRERAASDGIALPVVNEVSELPGKGLSGVIAGQRLTVTGRGKLPPAMREQLPPIVPGLECIVLVDELLAGVFRFHDQPRPDSQPFLRHVGTRHGIERIVLLSGDRPQEVAAFAEAMGITEVYGGMSPEQKVEVVRKLTAEAPTLYLGDGINDAPAMMTATAGVALGMNSDITAEAAGAVILQSSLEAVDELIHIGHRMRRIALESAVGGMALSLGGMIAASFGVLPPLKGALAQEGIDLLSILNSLRMIAPRGPLADFKTQNVQPAHVAGKVAS